MGSPARPNGTLNTLIRARFQVRRVEEFAPTREQIRAEPQLAEELDRPMMLLVSARAPAQT
jgi:hypothetical protein